MKRYPVGTKEPLGSVPATFAGSDLVAECMEWRPRGTVTARLVRVRCSCGRIRYLQVATWLGNRPRSCSKCLMRRRRKGVARVMRVIRARGGAGDGGSGLWPIIGSARDVEALEEYLERVGEIS